MKQTRYASSLLKRRQKKRSTGLNIHHIALSSRRALKERICNFGSVGSKNVSSLFVFSFTAPKGIPYGVNGELYLAKLYIASGK